MRTHILVGSLVFVISFVAAGGAAETPPESEGRAEPKVLDKPHRTERTLGDVLGSAEWATVADGFVLRVYSSRQVARINERRAAHGRRREEYLAKRAPLVEKLGEIHQQLPDSRYRQYAASLFQRWDSNKDGVIDSEEQERASSIVKGSDANKDGRITLGELMVSFLSRTRAGSRSLAPENVPEGKEELSAELDSLNDRVAKLEQEYEDVLKTQASIRFYKVKEVAKEFIRIQHEQEERLIPFASIREVKWTVDD